MKVAVYYNNNDVRLEEMPIPQIGPGELLVKVMASGICGSDVLEWYRLKKAPLVLGHEIAGVIEQAGEGVERYKAGDRVFVSHHVPCNTCHYCLGGHHTACRTLHATNYFPGGFSEYIRVPKLNVDRGVFILPDEISFEEATFVEPVACVLRGQRRAALRPGHTVLALGSGISGLLHLLVARISGAARVIMTDINRDRLRTAQQLGADGILLAHENIREQVLEMNDNRLADLAIVCAGDISAFNQALESVDRGGTVLCFATTDPNTRLSVPINEFWRSEINLTPSYGNSPYDAEAAINLIGAGRLPVRKLITHRLKLAETGLGFKLVSEAANCLKVIIEPHSPYP